MLCAQKIKKVYLLFSDYYLIVHSILYTMKKKIKIKINGKLKIIDDKTKLSVFLEDHKVPLSKVAIELNRKIVDKKKLMQIFLKTNDKLEIVHFIGGG